MWHFISDKISEAIGDTFICETAKLIQKQHSHACYLLKSAQKRFFVKLHEAKVPLEHPAEMLTSLQCEAEGLAAIQATKTIKSPTLICQGAFEESQKQIEYLVMQYICFKAPSESLWQLAGKQLAAMHQCSTEDLLNNHSARYGWPHKNWVGSTVQENLETTTWATFYIEQRLAPLLDMLTKKNITTNISTSLLERMHAFLSGHKPVPSLLHGDLWSGNIGFSTTSPILFDPAIYVGDREIDLAMAHLFGGFAKSFFQSYENQFPLTEGAEQRLALYQLYPVLNHALMFGGDYIQQANQLIKKIQLDIA